MRFNITQIKPNYYAEATLTHQSKTLYWDIQKYSRSKPLNTACLFDNFNQWVSTFSGGKQTQLFEQFEAIHTVFEHGVDVVKLHRALAKHLSEIYTLLEFDALKQWALNHAVVFIPPDLKTIHEPTETQLTINMTYLRDDYYNLVVLSILLKPLMVVFGQYMSHTEKEVANAFKEHYALGLLRDCAFIKTAVFERLVVYVNTLSENELRKKSLTNSKRAAIFSGLGSEELPTWLLAKALVRRIVVHEEQMQVSIISSVYQIVKQKVNGLNSEFNSRVDDKEFYSDENSEDNTSILENYKVKQEITDGDLEVLSYYMRRVEPIYATVDPTADPKKRAHCEAFFNENPLIEVTSVQLVLAQWVLARAISPRSLPLLNKVALLNGLSVTQTLLWHWGYLELALLMGASPCEEVSYASSAPPTQLSKAHYETFAKHYPHYRQPNRSNTAKRQNNVVCRAINELSNRIVHHDWLVHGPEPLLTRYGYHYSGYRHIVSAEIRNTLGALVTKLVELESSELN